jgi:hypothetical protein
MTNAVSTVRVFYRKIVSPSSCAAGGPSKGPLAIHAAAKVDAEEARQLGLNPDKLISSAFVGFVVLVDVRPDTKADARLLKKRRAGFGWFPGNFSWVLKEPRRIAPINAKGQLPLFGVPKAVEGKFRRLH